MLLGEDILVAGDGAEDVADFRGLFHAHNAESVHDGFERFGWIDFGDDHFGSGAPRTGCQTASAPAVASDNKLRPGKKEVRSANDAAVVGLAWAVEIIE